MKRRICALLAALLLPAVLSGCFLLPTEEELPVLAVVDEQTAETYKLSYVTRGDLEQWVSITCRFQSLQQEHLRFQYDGRTVGKVYVEVGDDVVPGQLLAELDDKRGIGLITRVRQGQGKPDKIFVHKCVLPEMLKGHFQKCQNDMSGNVEMTGQDMSKGHANKTDRNHTEYSETQSIYQAEQMWMEDGTKEYEEYREYFMEQLYMDSLLADYPFEKETLYEILELLVETVCSRRKTIRIAGDDKPAQIVKSRLMKLNGEHIRYVLACMKENTTKVRNIRQYLLAALYNAPATISNYYAALVNHDLYGGGG